LPEVAVGLPAGTAEPPMRVPIHDLVVKLYEESREPVCRYLLGLGVTPAEADDLCQEAFLRLFAALRKGQQIRNPRAWVFTVAHNSGLNARSGFARFSNCSFSNRSARARCRRERTVPTGQAKATAASA